MEQFRWKSDKEKYEASLKRRQEEVIRINMSLKATATKSKEKRKCKPAKGLMGGFNAD